MQAALRASLAQQDEELRKRLEDEDRKLGRIAQARTCVHTRAHTRAHTHARARLEQERKSANDEICEFKAKLALQTKRQPLRTHGTHTRGRDLGPMWTAPAHARACSHTAA